MLLYNDFDQHVIVYNVESGDTHLLDKMDADILQAMLDLKLSNRQLEDKVLNSGRCGNKDDAAAYLRQLIKQLTELGLLEDWI